MRRIKVLFMMLLCVLTICCSTPMVFAANPAGGSGTTGFGEDAIGFEFDDQGNLKITTAAGVEDAQGFTKTIITKLRVFSSSATAIVILVIAFILVITFGRMAVKAHNSQARAQNGEAILWILFSVAGVVAVPILIGLFANLLN